MNLIFNIMASLLLISIITASSPNSSPTKHLPCVKNAESAKHENKCAICKDILFKLSWTPEEAYEHGKFFVKRVTSNEVHGLHLLCLGRYRDRRNLEDYWSKANESQFRELIKGSFNHIIAGFIENQALGPWIQYVELCSWVQEQDVMDTISPLCEPESLIKPKELLRLLIAGKVPQNTPIIKILTSLTVAKTKRAAEEPVLANLKEGSPGCSAVQALENSAGGPKHRKREAYRASSYYPPIFALDCMHPTGLLLFLIVWLY